MIFEEGEGSVEAIGGDGDGHGETELFPGLRTFFAYDFRKHIETCDIDVRYIPLQAFTRLALDRATRHRINGMITTIANCGFSVLTREIERRRWKGPLYFVRAQYTTPMQRRWWIKWLLTFSRICKPGVPGMTCS